MRGGSRFIVALGLVLALVAAPEGRANPPPGERTTWLGACVNAFGAVYRRLSAPFQDARDIAAARAHTYLQAEWLIREFRDGAGRQVFDDYIATAKLLRENPPLALALSEVAGRRAVADPAEARRRVDEALARPELAHLAESFTASRRELLAKALEHIRQTPGITHRPGEEVVSAYMGLTKLYLPDRTPKPTNYRVAADGTRVFYVVPQHRNGDARKPGYHAPSGQYESREAWALGDLIREGRVGLEDGKHLYVVTPGGEIRVAPFRDGWPHPTLIGGENPEIVAAGEIVVRGGRVAEVNEESGHYRPWGTLEVMRRHFDPVLADVKTADFQYRTRPIPDPIPDPVPPPRLP